MRLESKINNVMKLELKSRKKKLYIYMGWREGWQKAKKKKRGGKGGTTCELPMSSCLKGMRLETDFRCGIVLREETSCFINEHICTY